MTSSKVHYGYLLSGFLCLISASFIDNIRGPMLPTLCEELGISYSEAGNFLAIGSIAAVISMLGLGRLLPLVSDKSLTVGICIFCGVPGLIAPFISGIFGLMTLGISMGIAVILLGSISSILAVNGSPLRIRGKDFLSIRSCTG